MLQVTANWISQESTSQRSVRGNVALVEDGTTPGTGRNTVSGYEIITHITTTEDATPGQKRAINA